MQTAQNVGYGKDAEAACGNTGSFQATTIDSMGIVRAYAIMRLHT